MRQHNIRKSLTNYRNELLKKYNNLEFDKSALILYGVDKSTIRSFHHNKHYKIYKPSSIYRTWCQSYLENEMDRILESKRFSTIHNHAFKSLQTYWLDVDSGTPEDYKFYKLIDLLFKFIPRLTSIKKERAEWLFENANAPIDQFSLKCYRKYSDNKLEVPLNPSMNFVDSKDYHKIQNEFRKLVKPHSLLLFDLFAWK